MGDRHSSGERGQRRAHRARRVALNHKEVGRSRETRQESGRHGLDMPVRILLAGTFQRLRQIAAEPEVSGIEDRVLARKDQPRRQPALGESMGERRQLDGFRSGADDQPDIYSIQPSP
jgi:hypothetical protein